MGFEIPTNYNELSKKDYQRVCYILANNTPENQLMGLYYFLKLKWWSRKYRKQTQTIRELPAEWVHTLMTDNTLLGWLFTKPEIKKYFIKSFFLKGMVYAGPPKGILNINASEFVFSYTFFKKYAQTQNAVFLDNLLAVLYRPVNPFYFLKAFTFGYGGDKRISLNNYLFEKRVKRFSKLPHDLKLGVFMQFSSAWEQFEKREEYKYLFGKTNEKDNKQKKEDPLLWEKIMMKMAESGVFGNYNDVQLMDKDRFFLCMQKNIEEYLEAKDARK